MKRLIFDFETRSECDLKKAGAYKYSLHPSTKPTCLAFKVRGESRVYFLNFYVINRQWVDQEVRLQQMWLKFIDEDYEFTGHNAFFEKCVYENILVKRYGWPTIPFRQYRCTAAKAAACALPRNLEGAGAALNLSTQKDKRGYVAMMATCKPTRRSNDFHKMVADISTRLKEGRKLTPKQIKWQQDKTKHLEPKKFLEPEDDPAMWNTLYEYCKIDVRTEELLDETLPDLTPEEQEIWFLNQDLNWRGLTIDIPTVEKIVGIMDVESKKKLKELDSLTMGLVTKPGARQSILDFLALEGIELPDIKKQTVEDSLSSFHLSENGRRLLEIRKALSMTSTRKYQSFLNRANEDHRVRDILMYHGASTGRDTGTGVQPHNFPRGLLKIDPNRPYAAIQNVIECSPEMLKFLYGEDSLPVVFSAILRNMIIPTPGYEIYSADFSKIEVAVLWWLANNVPGLDILESGKDPYIYMAAANTGKTYEEIEAAVKREERWAIDARQLGKAQVLGCGFGMGYAKFQSTAWDMYRLRLNETQAIIAVHHYREFNKPVTDLWKAYEKAAVMAVEQGMSHEAGKCVFQKYKKFLWVRLPSGRSLAYHDPQISWRETDFGPRKTLEFWAVNSKTKKWALERTWGGTLTENIVQAIARDLMMSAMVRLDKAGYRALLAVHDEAITESKIGQGDLDQFKSIMCKIPKWGKGLPIDAKGWVGPRYRK